MALRTTLRNNVRQEIIDAATDAGTRVYAGKPPDNFGEATLPACYVSTPGADTERLQLGPVGTGSLLRTQEIEIVYAARGNAGNVTETLLDEGAAAIEAALKFGPGGVDSFVLDSETMETDADTGDNVHGIITLVYIATYQTAEGDHNTAL